MYNVYRIIKKFSYINNNQYSITTAFQLLFTQRLYGQCQPIWETMSASNSTKTMEIRSNRRWRDDSCYRLSSSISHCLKHMISWFMTRRDSWIPNMKISWKSEEKEAVNVNSMVTLNSLTIMWYYDVMIASTLWMSVEVCVSRFWIISTAVVYASRHMAWIVLASDGICLFAKKISRVNLRMWIWWTKSKNTNSASPYRLAINQTQFVNYINNKQRATTFSPSSMGK